MKRIIRPLSQEFLYASPEAVDRYSYRLSRRVENRQPRLLLPQPVEGGRDVTSKSR